MKKITVGIIGCGVIAPTHIECYKSVDGVEIKWACDLVEYRAVSCSEKYNISKPTTSYYDILNDPEVDAVSICTDHNSHAAISVDALKAGKHILCEKALTSSPANIEKMLDMHKKFPKIIFAAVFQHRFDAIFRLLREQIQSGAFGTITAVNLVSFLLRKDSYYSSDAWRGTWEYEGGSLLINQSIHYIDLLVWLFGEVESVCARVENITHGDSIETEDTAALLLRFKNGILGTVTATSSSVETWRNEISVSGTDGYIRIKNESVAEYKFLPDEQQKKFDDKLQKCIDDKAFLAGKDYYGEGHPAQIADFISSIREERNPFIGVVSAAATMKLLYACYESSKTGQWINLSSDVHSS